MVAFSMPGASLTDGSWILDEDFPAPSSLVVQIVDLVLLKSLPWSANT